MSVWSVMDLYERSINRTILKRLRERRRFIQVLHGPRQVGKTTAARQVMQEIVGLSRRRESNKAT